MEEHAKHPIRHRLLGAREIPARTAFTLLEVLVAIAAIALLIAVLMPSLGKARWQSRHLLCQTNLASIGKAWHAYLADSRGWFPKSLVGIENKEINYGGRQGKVVGYLGPKSLNRYLGLALVTERNAETFRCPFDRGSGSARPTCFEYYGSSYLMNPMLVGLPSLLVAPTDPCRPVLKQVSARIAKLNVSQLANESRLLWVGDYGWYYAWNWQMPARVHVEWHSQAMWHNVAFVDGHVQFTRIHKGLHTTSDYTVIPYREQQAAVCECQREVHYP